MRIPRIPVAEEELTRRIIPVSDPQLDGNELRYLTQCVQSNWISSAGRFVREFEQAFSTAMGCEHGIACANGTTSLHLALATLGLGPGDEVVIPTFTMIATANAVRYAGASPVLVDAERDTWNLAVDGLDRAITPRTAGSCSSTPTVTRSTWTPSSSWPSAGVCGSSRTPPRRTARPIRAGASGVSGGRLRSPSTRTRSSPAARAAW